MKKTPRLQRYTESLTLKEQGRNKPGFRGFVFRQVPLYRPACGGERAL
jgi:hypothetical protein